MNNNNSLSALTKNLNILSQNIFKQHQVPILMNFKKIATKHFESLKDMKINHDGFLKYFMNKFNLISKLNHVVQAWVKLQLQIVFPSLKAMQKTI